MYGVDTSVYMYIRHVYAVYARFGWHGRSAYNVPYTVHYTSTRRSTQYYTLLKMKICVYARPKREPYGSLTNNPTFQCT